MSRVASAIASGLLFGLGLAVSGLANPDKVLNFLDLAGRWDPSLALVMVAALAVAAPGFAWVHRRRHSLGGAPLAPKPGSRIDRRLLSGSALSGIGWGIAGYSPGPALANLAYGTSEAALFVIALLVGSQLARFTSGRR